MATSELALPGAGGVEGLESHAAPAAVKEEAADSGTQVNAALVGAIYKLIALAVFLVLSVLALVAVNFYLHQRKPDLVVIREGEDGRQVAVLNNREMGTSANVTVSKDRVTDKDKITAASKFASAIYGVSPVPEVRARDISQAVMQFVPQRAEKLSKYLEPILAKQKAENWSTVWKEQTAYVDPNDKLLVHIIGTQEIDSFPQNVPTRTVVQFNLSIKLTYDRPMHEKQNGNPRAERNLNTGFLIFDYTGEEIKK